MGVFTRRAQSGGDIGVWAPFQQAQDYLSNGAMTAYCYKSGASLYISAGRVGIDNGSSVGAAIFLVPESIDFSACSNNNWFKVELSVSGSSATLAAADIAGETDSMVLPTTATASYDGLKGGFYMTPTKRLIMVGWKTSNGVYGIVNFHPNRRGWSGYAQKYAAGGYEYFTTRFECNGYTERAGFPPVIGDIGDWNMDLNATCSISNPAGLLYPYIKSIHIIIRVDDDAGGYDPTTRDVLWGNTTQGGFTLTQNTIIMYRVAGGRFDDPDWDKTSYNRGTVEQKFEPGFEL